MDRFGRYSWIVWYPVGGWGKWSTKELTTFFTQSGLKKNTMKEKSTGNSSALHSFLLLNSYFFSSFSSIKERSEKMFVLYGHLKLTFLMFSPLKLDANSKTKIWQFFFLESFCDEPRQLILVEDRYEIVYVKKKTSWNKMTQQFLEIVIFLNKTTRSYK